MNEATSKAIQPNMERWFDLHLYLTNIIAKSQEVEVLSRTQRIIEPFCQEHRALEKVRSRPIPSMGQSMGRQTADFTTR